MRNFNIFISIAVALIVAVAIFWFGGAGFPTPEALQPSVAEEVRDTQDVQEEVLINIDSEIGEYLVDPRGISLYTTSNDCTEECLVIWPPYVGERSKASGELGVVYNEELGTDQYTWKGEALYYYASDQNIGDIKGDGVGGVWDVARP